MQTDEIGCHVITVTNDILKKLPLIGKNLGAYSLETVQMSYEDGKAAGYKLSENERKMASVSAKPLAEPIS
jgi:transaldolase